LPNVRRVNAWHWGA